jgi:hypothetical protein
LPSHSMSGSAPWERGRRAWIFNTAARNGVCVAVSLATCVQVIDEIGDLNGTKESDHHEHRERQ